MILSRRKLFCEYGPLCYRIALEKEILRKRLRDWRAGLQIARCRQSESLPALVKGHRSPVLRRLVGVDMALQENKGINLALAAAEIDGVVVAPGETFSFWALVGQPTARRGFVPGLALGGGRMQTAVGGGLCQLANLIHYLVLHSPLTVTELHHHTDALFPDDRRRVPFGTGTSVFCPHLDYRFLNSTSQPVQIRVWLSEGDLCGELRAETPFLCRYRLAEVGHCFVQEEDGWYRVSQVYRRSFDRATGLQTGEELILDNHSRVLYDPALIPPEEIAPREETSHASG